MRVLQCDNVLCVDVDDTLVSWEPVPIDPYDLSGPRCDRADQSTVREVEIELEGETQKYWAFEANIKSLKTHYHKGHSVVVWSGSGHAWAEAVVRALGLENYVELVMAKPRWLLDDMKPADFLPTPYWGSGDPGKTKLK